VTKEEFESWIEADGNIQEAFDRLPLSDRSHERWLKLFALSLASIAKEEEGEDPEEDDGLSEELDEELDTEDEEEEESKEEEETE